MPPGRIVVCGGVVLAALWCAIWVATAPDPALMRQLAFLPGVGVIGAIIANTSGTGGGVVFVPVFNGLREHGVMALDPLQITAASMGIQCFGMTMGALRWTDRLMHQAPPPDALHSGVRPRDYALAAVAVLAISLPAMLAVQRMGPIDNQAILVTYKAFSIPLGLALIAATWTVNRNVRERERLEPVDLAVLMLLAAPGGAITALLSVGIGELVALYLFIRHYPVLLSTGVACVVSSVSVLSGMVWHTQAGTVQWEVVLLAGPGAALGGFLARSIAHWLGARRLKTLDGLWIVLSASYLVWLNWR
ncbi:Sulfite exporter TauE/SafE [Tsuneonella dongtanensis]|uniref:Probable membrane transporter protein n=1 Tax=Tsuneonella dongtanensis TaxID=692370 RepID=A0A1B2AGV1_9SPHN|nr:Sulfite exporter TauE/SafE [Tsuneonella dongtanensis]